MRSTALAEPVIDYRVPGNPATTTKTVGGHPAPSSAGFALLIFVTVFLFLTRVTANRERIDALVRNITVDRWCHRFEKYITSSANPDIVIIGSSTALVPSEMCDVAFQVAPRLPDLVALQSYSEHYEVPAFFLKCLSSRGLSSVSALNLSNPTADGDDEHMLLKQLVAFGKKPKLVVLAIGPRDFAVWPCEDLPLFGSPISRCLRGIKQPPKQLLGTQIVPWLLVYLRARAIAHVWEDEKYYFSCELTRLLKPAKQATEKFVPLATHLPEYKEANSKYSVADAWSKPNKEKIDLSPTQSLLSYIQPAFVDNQVLALEEAAKLLQRNGIKLVVVETPMCVGAEFPAWFSQKYFRSTESICRRYGAKWFRPASKAKFETSDFMDALHMNAFGGYKWFTSTARFISDHRQQLLD